MANVPRLQLTTLALMKLVEPCPLCKISTACDCKAPIVDFLMVLNGIQNRILSNKAASEILNPPMISAGVDKLNIKFKELYKTSDLIQTAKDLNLNFKYRTLENKWCLKIQRDDLFCDFPLALNAEFCAGVISNPNRFKKWKTYITFLENLVSPEVLLQAEISRLDLNIDFAVTLKELISSLDIEAKSLAEFHTAKSGAKTGYYYGKKPELFCVYDKGKKERTDELRTRLECRMYNKKLPTKFIYELPLILRAQEHFKGVRGVDVKFTENLSSDERNQKLDEFKSILYREGFYSAKKTMNSNRNFNRDFGHLVRFQNWTKQPKNLFAEGISIFLQKDLELGLE